MDNQIKENNNQSIQDTYENLPKISVYKINILASVENENIKENEENINSIKKNNSKKNLLLLGPNPTKKKFKKKMKNILESSFRSKKRSSVPSQGKGNDNQKDYKSNIVVINNNENEYSNKGSELYSRSFISPRAKNKITKEKNESEFNLGKLADQLYEKEEHFQKSIFSKKAGLNDSINTVKKDESFISDEIIKKKRKNYLKLDSIDKDISNGNLLNIIDQDNDNKRRKSNISSSSKGMSSNYNTKKDKKKNNNCSNFRKLKLKNDGEKKEDGEGGKNKIKQISNDMINNNSPLKKNLSSKVLRIFGSKKTVNENADNKSRNTKKKSSNKIRNNKSQINNNNKKDKKKKNTKDTKGKKFYFFCCLNSKDNDSDDNCN